ncbi:MAG: efflux RND transporter permease subunit, partial [Treponema sp.]|nr:efflux RND transporter permease subunit [Treponema sp.]
MNALLKRKKASLCAGLGICAISVCVLAAGGELKRNGLSYSVRVRHYGVDAEEMERTVTIPLEDALFSIPGARTVRSSSENSGSRVLVVFSRPERGQYEAVREAVQGVYETLPASVQRPEIFSSDDSRIPVWSAAVSWKDLPAPDSGAAAGRNASFGPAGEESDAAFLLERFVKPGLKGLEGVGEVLISGTGLREIIVAPDQDKLASLGIGASALSAALETNDALFPGGYIAHNGREIILTVDGRYAPETGDSSGLGEVLVSVGGGRALPLSAIAGVYERERPPDTLSRLNGKKAAVVSVMGTSGADLGKLSREIKRELDALSLPLEFTVLSDRGAEEAEAFTSVLFAALQGSLMVSLTVFLMNRGARIRIKKAGLICSLSVPAACLVSAAFLSAGGIPPDRSVLAGLSVGVGAAVDAAILCAEELRRCRNYAEAGNALAGLRGPLTAGSVTTFAALLPLALTDFGGSAVIARAIAAVTLAALALSLTLLPPLLLWDMGEGAAARGQLPLPRLVRRVSRYAHRFLAADIRLCVRRNRQILAAGLLFSALGVAALFMRGADAGKPASEYSVYARIEFEGGFLAEEGDLLLAAFSESLAGKTGIRNVQTEAGTSGGSALILFDPARTNADRVRELARSFDMAGGFLFFPETTPGERHWEIKIFGDDDRKCRELAGEMAALC